VSKKRLSPFLTFPFLVRAPFPGNIGAFVSSPLEHVVRRSPRGWNFPEVRHLSSKDDPFPPNRLYSYGHGPGGFPRDGHISTSLPRQIPLLVRAPPPPFFFCLHKGGGDSSQRIARSTLFFDELLLIMYSSVFRDSTPHFFPFRGVEGSRSFFVFFLGIFTQHPRLPLFSCVAIASRPFSTLSLSPVSMLFSFLRCRRE